MSTPIVLPEPEYRLEEAAVLAAVREAFGELAAGRAVQPPQVVTDLPDGGDVIAYQAVLPDAGVYAVKVSPYLPQPEGKAVVTAWTLLVSTRTGQPLLLADSAGLTVERTAATTALAVDLLARPGARSVAVVGLGPVGVAHLRYARLVRRFDEVRVFARSAEPDTVASLGSDVTLTASADDAAAGADVVLLCTSAASPVVDVRALAPGALVDVDLHQRAARPRDRPRGAVRPGRVLRPRARGARLGRRLPDRRRGARIRRRARARRPPRADRGVLRRRRPASGRCSSAPSGSGSRTPRVALAALGERAR